MCGNMGINPPAERTPMQEKDRFEFIGHALRGDGPFRPKVTIDSYGKAYDVGKSYLVRYPRESEEKFARRNEIAFYASPLQSAASRFASYISGKAVQRDGMTGLYESMSEDIDGKGNNLDVFWQDFMVGAKARGSMLLLVDMPQSIGTSLADQLENRRSPYWTPIDPEMVTGYRLTEAGSFEYVEFAGTFPDDDDKDQPCTWYFDDDVWQRLDREGKVKAEGTHGLGVCPMLIFTEHGDFPCYGSFAPIADLSKRLFNLNSELDEILRSQTFSILALNVPEGSVNADVLDAAKTAGETIGASSLLMYSGSQPDFIAPPDGPARIYLDRIESIKAEIQEIALQVATPNQRESGLAMQTRFAMINAELSRFSKRMEDFEYRAWDLTARWLNVANTPESEWPRDFNISNIDQEMEILRGMQETAMTPEVIQQQQKRIVRIQFDGAPDDELETMISSIDNGASAA